MHKLRSSLAMLGILIGVTAVIWLVALGEGVSYQAQQQIKELGATNIIIKSVKPSIGGGTGGSPMVIYGLKWTDFHKIERIPTVKAAVPMREIRRKAYYGQMEAKDIQFVGCTPEYFGMNRLAMDRGRFITDRDADGPDNVVVLASNTAEYYFPYEN